VEVRSLFLIFNNNFFKEVGSDACQMQELSECG